MSIMRRMSLITATSFVWGLIAVLFWPGPAYSRSRVDPGLLELREPFRSVETDYYLDGGSVGVRITDHDGRIREFALPVSASGPRRYERVFIGAMSLSKRGQSPMEISTPEDTKNLLIEIVGQHSPPDVNTRAALCALRGLPRDYAAIWLPGLFKR
jgi:hypothetical protein